MKALGKWHGVMMSLWLASSAVLAAGPTREEMKIWSWHQEEGGKAFGRLQKDVALQHFFAALPIAEKFGPKDVRLAQNLQACGLILADAGLPDLAEPLCARSATVRESARGASHRETAWAWLLHARVLVDLGKFTEAEALVQRARRNLEKAFGPYHPSLGECMAVEAASLAKQGRHAQAEVSFKEALQRLNRTSLTLRGPPGESSVIEVSMGPMRIASVEHALAHMYVEAGRFSDAAAVWRDVIKRVEQTAGKSHGSLVGVYAFLAKAQMRQKDFAAAGASIDHAVKLCTQLAGEEHATSLIARFCKVDWFVAQEKWKEAELEADDIMAFTVATIPANSEAWLPLLETMIKVDERRGKLDEVAKHRAQILEIQQLRKTRFAVPKSR